MKKLYVRNDSQEMTIKILFEEFLIAKKCINVSPYTISYYERCFKAFSKYFDVETPCISLTQKDINGYILYMKDRDDINDITINTNIRGIRAVLYYGMEHGYINPFKIKLIRADKKIKETYSDAELAILLKKT